VCLLKMASAEKSVKLQGYCVQNGRVHCLCELIVDS
jgi:hypothetical protein